MLRLRGELVLPTIRCSGADIPLCSVQLLPSSSSSTTPSKEIAQTGVVALSFSPLSSTLFTFERPVKSDTDVHKNVKAWDVTSGEEVGSWYQKSLEDWCVDSAVSTQYRTDSFSGPL